MKKTPLILVIDDEIEILKALKESLEDEHYLVETLSQGQKTLDTIGTLIPDMILLDIFMPNCNGLELLESIKKEYPSQKIIIISGFGNIQIATEAIKKGALDFIEKPLNLDKILSKINFLKESEKTFNVDKQLNKKDVDQENNVIIKNNLGITGKSFLFLELLNQLEKISRLPLPTIIYGQPGTGKSLLALYMHKIGPASDKDFIKIDCIKLHCEKLTDKMESSFNSTNIGSIYFKNIHVMDSENQKRLLFNMEQCNIRIIASSPKHLFNLFKKNEFNSSLYFKMSLIPMEIPPLNKRRYDIPLLIDSFLKQSNLLYEKHVLLNNKSIRTLRNHNWTGNVEELKQLISRVVQTSTDPYQIVIPEEINNLLNEKDIQFIEEQSFTRFDSLNKATEEFEKRFLLYLLKKNSYNIEQVCDRLNLSPSQLKNKMLELNI